MTDIERGQYEALAAAELQGESEALLFNKSDDIENVVSLSNHPIRSGYSIYHLLGSFSIGVLACALAQYIIARLCASSPYHANTKELLAPPYAGSTEVHPFPPATPTNAFPSLFPTGLGYAGYTATGAEPALVATAPAYPVHTGAPQLVVSSSLEGAKGLSTGNAKYDIFKKWGNLSPWYTVDRTAFGLDTGPDAPAGCRITGLHFLHRHGARYPTGWGMSVLYNIDNKNYAKSPMASILWWPCKTGRPTTSVCC